MTKKLFFKKSSAIKILSCLMIPGSLLLGSVLQAQMCAGTENIPANGETMVNGIKVTSSSSGSVVHIISPIGSIGPTACNGAATSSGGALIVGQDGPWSVTLTFDKPVNNLLIVLTSTGSIVGDGGNENFIFNSNGGPVSITSTSSCLSTINDNEILSGLGANPVGGGNPGVGGGNFIISSPNEYTSLTINGAGGYYGSEMGICSASIVLGVKDIHSEVEDSNRVTISPNPVKDMMTISSKNNENLQSYKILDESGKLIVYSPLKGKEQEVDLSSVKTGYYIVLVETEKRTVKKKIVKE